MCLPPTLIVLMRSVTISFVALCLITQTLPGFAGEPPAPRYSGIHYDVSDPLRVDVALVLAVDVSSSIERGERLFQRRAYAQALSDPRVANMALGGGAGRVAIAYMEWSGHRFQRVHLPMRVLSSAAELRAFAEDILSIPDRDLDPMYAQPTAVGDALIAAETVMASLPVPARDYVIDISGDGVVNDGTAVRDVRNRLLAMGLTLNGLPIEVRRTVPVFEDFQHNDVARFYADCVIGGPGAFHVVARGFADVRETLIMKLMLEMAAMPAGQKHRIATAWNTRAAPSPARLLPAMTLELAPSQAPAAPVSRSNCGEPQYNAKNPFQIIP